MTDQGYFRHPNALVESTFVGARTRVWAFAHIAADAVVGQDCNICDHTFIEGGAIIGDRVTLKCGVQVWNGVTLEDDVFVGPNATFTNDLFPRSRQPFELATTVVRRGATIGANATILPGLEIGAHAMIGAGSVVTKNVPEHALVVGNPARIVRSLANDEPHAPAKAVVSLDAFTLSQADGSLPFTPRRVVLAVDAEALRGALEGASEKVIKMACGKASLTLSVGERSVSATIEPASPALQLDPKSQLVTCSMAPGSIALVLHRIET